MEIRALAEQILFANSLEEKLQSPKRITDQKPGQAIIVPVEPGRPRTLKFKAQRNSKSTIPGIQQLQQPEQRGKLLHFFANHELLAVELMALVLLRFPDAPPAFRQGVFQTLRDEQEHTQLYINRMRECGIEFGELPVSGYFWRALSGMQNPLDYVAGLSLTFEQANLDFSKQFADAFAAIGDHATSQLLGRIYQDEISHVAYGLKWFRRWKNPQQSDWEAFCSQLKFPLSPQRAKGLILNKAARRAAGLDESFVSALSVYSKSKGRTPTAFVFNPFTEGYIAGGKAFTPVRHQAALARDLANLPQFICRKDDIVLLSRRPSVDFLEGIQQSGFDLPEFVEFGSEPGAVAKLIGARPLAGLRPWAWGPDSLEMLGPLQQNIKDRAPSDFYNESVAQLYSKGWSAKFLAGIVAGLPAEDASWICQADDVGQEAGSLREAIEIIQRIRSAGHHRIVVKQLFGLAGHNAIRLWEPQLQSAQIAWLEKSLAHGRKVLVEPWQERKFDFSVQLEMSAAGLKLLGITTLLVDQRGQYVGNAAAPNFRRSFPRPALAAFESKDISRKLNDLYSGIISRLEEELRAAGYLGPIGIDAFIYRDGQGRARLKPVVEINPRYTMGRVTIELMNHVCPGTTGLFRIVNRAQLTEAGFEAFSAFAASLVQNQPLQLAGEPVRRISGGALCLNDPSTAECCLAVFETKPGSPRD